MLWAGVERGRGRGPGPAGVRATCRCWSTSRARSSPSAVTRWRSRCTASRATCPRPSATTWRCWAGAPATRRSCPLRPMLEQFRLEDVQRSPAFFDVKKLSHMNGVYIRALPVDGFMSGAGRGSTRCRGSGRRESGATPTPVRRSCRRRAWAAGALRRGRVRRGGRGDPGAGDRVERGAGAGRFLVRGGRAGSTTDSWQKAIAGDEARAADPGRRAGRLRGVPVGQGRAARGDAGHRARRWGASWARRRRRSGSP